MGLRRLGDAVRNVVDDVEARDALLLEEIHRVRVLLAENGDQDVRSGDLLLARGLDVQDGALDHALEAQRRLGVDLAVGGDPRCLLDDVLRSEEHTSELQSRFDLVCRLLLEKKNKYRTIVRRPTLSSRT